MYKVDISSADGQAFDISEGTGSFRVDPQGGGLTPPGALLAGLGSCTGVYIRKYAAGAKLAIGGFDISVSADLSADAPHRFSHIAVAISFRGAALDDRRKAALAAFLRNCPVHNTLTGTPSISLLIR